MFDARSEEVLGVGCGGMMCMNVRRKNWALSRSGTPYIPSRLVSALYRGTHSYKPECRSLTFSSSLGYRTCPTIESIRPKSKYVLRLCLGQIVE
jgi:hypothetical protein